MDNQESHIDPSVTNFQPVQPTQATIEQKPKPLFTVSMKTLKHIVIGLILLTVGFIAGNRWSGDSSNSYTQSQVSNAIQEQLGLSTEISTVSKEDLDFTLFWQVWSVLEERYLEEEDIDPQEMLYGAIRGMTAAVGDPYTVFLPPVDNQRAREDLGGSFDGVGIQLGFRNDMITVIAPLEGMPASFEDVNPGDIIVNIKDEANEVDEDTGGMSLQEAVNLIRGEKGTPVTLTLYRESKGSFDVTIKRDTILVPSLTLTFGRVDDGNWIEDASGNVAHLRLSRFGERTLAEWEEKVDEIIARGDNIEGVVLDMRNNPGGFLGTAIDLASEFVSAGTIVSQQGKTSQKDFEASRRGKLIGTPVVVLVNEGSASASEILAGALRDQVNAPVVGKKSFGKGTVQEVVNLPEKAGLHVTTARWLLPNGDWIHEKGITPQYEVEIDFERFGEEDFVDQQLVVGAQVLTGDYVAPESSDSASLDLPSGI